MNHRNRPLYIYFMLPYFILLAAMITAQRAWQANHCSKRILFFFKVAQTKVKWYVFLTRIYVQAAFITLWREMKAARVHVPTRFILPMRRQALSYLLIVTMVVAMMPAMAVTAEAADGYETWALAGQNAVLNTDYSISGTTYTINTAKGLAWVAWKTNTDTEINGFTGAAIQLGANIDLNNGTVTGYDSTVTATNSWIPIGKWGNPGLPFRGTFDGNGHTISSLKVNTSNGGVLGLFGMVDGATIQKVGIKSGLVIGHNSIGGIVGFANKSIILSCYNKATIQGDAYSGGIAGNLNDSTVQDCYNTADIGNSSNNNGSVGGIVGIMQSTTGTFSPLAFSTTCFVTQCYNTGTIYGGTHIGGIVGSVGYKLSGSTTYYFGGVITRSVSLGKALSPNLVEDSYAWGRVGYHPAGGGAPLCPNTESNYNYAWAGMTYRYTFNYSNEETAGAYKDGANLRYEESTNTLSKQFKHIFTTGSAWTFADNKLPILTVFAEGTQSTSLPVWMTQTAPSITTTSLAEGTVGTAYSETLAATGTTPITWSITSGSLPTGLSLNSSTGAITGTPSASATSSITIKAANSAGDASQSFTVTINPVPTYDNWTAAAQAATSGTDYTISGNTYTIKTAKGLAWVASVTNSDNATNGFMNKTIELANDIDLNDGTVTNYGSNAGTSWIPIGTLDNWFRGTFDGKGHTISNIIIKNTTADYQGFFGCIAGAPSSYSQASDPIIRNVGIASGSIQGKTYVGGLVGYLSYATIQNCFNKATVSGTSEVGGIVGRFRWASLIQDCYNTATISGSTYNVGGIAGYIESSTEVATIKNSYNTGTINASYAVGGIAGNNSADIVMNCISFGSALSSGGRIAFGGGTYTDNYAWSGMTVNGSIITSGGLSNNQGADLSLTSGVLSTQFSEVFGTTTPAIWTFEDNKLPILAGFSGAQESALPDRSTSSSTDTGGDQGGTSSGGDSNTGGSSSTGDSSNTGTTDDTDNMNFTDIDGTISIKGDIIKDKGKDDEGRVLNLQIDDETIVLPSDAIDFDEIFKKFGRDLDTKDVEFRFNIKEPTDGEKTSIKDATDKAGLRIVIPVSKFEISVNYEDTTYPVDKDDFYIERTMPIPEGVDPKDIATAIAVDEKGNIHHLPTKVVTIDGKSYVVYKGNYPWPIAIVANSGTFMDAVNHWAKDAIRDMTSRTIFMVQGPLGSESTMFSPDKATSRAEFTALLINALGLAPGVGETDFVDLDTGAWYYQYLQTAFHYGLIKGYGDGTFGPDDKITREQAMSMVYEAMKFIGMDVVLTEEDAMVLLEQYQDKSQISKYASQSITNCLKTGVIIGRTRYQLAPGQTITKAEVSVLLEKFLQRSGLI